MLMEVSLRLWLRRLRLLSFKFIRLKKFEIVELRRLVELVELAELIRAERLQKSISSIVLGERRRHKEQNDKHDDYTFHSESPLS